MNPVSAAQLFLEGRGVRLTYRDDEQVAAGHPVLADIAGATPA